MTGKELREDVAGRLAAACIEAAEFSEALPSHRVECDVRRRLLSQPQLRFSSLVVRRIDDGVCLEGVVETESTTTDVEQLAAAIDGVNQVLNRLVVHSPDQTPARKG